MAATDSIDPSGTSDTNMLERVFHWAFAQVYVAPYLVVNGWLVCITLLQHTHPALPHYNNREWDWLRGALSTVDRSYGPLDIVFHHIADTHVAHHLFSTMPHYHAQVRGGCQTVG